MTKWFFLIALSFVLLWGSVAPVEAASMSLSPAKKVLELRPGERASYQIQLRHDGMVNEAQVKVRDVIVDEKGVQRFPDDQTASASREESLEQWVSIPEVLLLAGATHIPLEVEVSIPENASQGQYFGVVAVSTSGGGGRDIFSAVALRVLGDQAENTGRLTSYDIREDSSQPGKTVFVVSFENTGRSFFTLEMLVEVFFDEAFQHSAQSFSRTQTVFPAELQELQIPVLGLGENVFEGRYFSRVKLFESVGGQRGELLTETSQDFEYIPAAMVKEIFSPIEKPVKVKSFFKQGEVIGGLILLGILIVVVGGWMFWRTKI